MEIVASVPCLSYITETLELYELNTLIKHEKSINNYIMEKNSDKRIFYNNRDVEFDHFIEFMDLKYDKYFSQ